MSLLDAALGSAVLTGQTKEWPVRTRRKALQVLAALVLVGSVVAAVRPAQAAAPSSLLTLNVTNDSGRNDKLYLYVVGVNLNTGRLGYVNEGGTFKRRPDGNITPTQAPDVAS